MQGIFLHGRGKLDVRHHLRGDPGTTPHGQTLVTFRYIGIHIKNVKRVSGSRFILHINRNGGITIGFLSKVLGSSVNGDNRGAAGIHHPRREGGLRIPFIHVQLEIGQLVAARKGHHQKTRKHRGFHKSR